MLEKREQILKSALEIVPFEGWTDKTLFDATGLAGLDKAYAKIAFSGGVCDLVEMYVRKLDTNMLSKLSAESFNNLSVRKKIAFAIKTRLELPEYEKKVILKTASYFAILSNYLNSIQSVWKTVDAIWYACGDNSSDFNHYTKRTLLAGVYSSTVLFWLRDNSENHSETWSFLDRRIENVMKINKIKGFFLARNA